MQKFQSKQFTIGQAKLKAVWADERIATICSEMDSVQVVKENTEAAKSPLALGSDEWRQLRHLACMGCRSHCEPATGTPLRVADTLRFLSYGETYGNLDKARGLFHAQPHEARTLTGADLAAAEAACPQGIALTQRLPYAMKILGA